MAKDFGKLNNKKMEAVAKKSNAEANLINIKMYSNEDLLDYENNMLSIEKTDDIEESIKLNGFIDPIHITDFNCEAGKYIIISGHRRRKAGVNLGMTSFPCILRHFNNEFEMRDYINLINNQRKVDDDPLYMCVRYKLTEGILKDKGEKKIREKVAKQLGLSLAQADRYSYVNKVIMPFWDLIRGGIIGISSVTDSGLYTHSTTEQEEILEIFKEAIDKKIELSRVICKEIVAGYRSGKKNIDDILKKEEKQKEPIMNLPIYEEEEKQEPHKDDEIFNPLRNNEVNYDTSHRENLPNNNNQYADERLTQEDYEVIDLAAKKEEKTEEEKRKKELVNGDKILNYLDKLDNLLELEFFEFDDISKTNIFVKTSSTFIQALVSRMEDVLNENNMNEKLVESTKTMIKEIREEVERLDKSIKNQ